MPDKRNIHEKKSLASSLRPLASALLRWYDKNRRILPWRALAGEASDPYRVWLSEVMLQQTTVGAVAPYFQKFVRVWPGIEDLAAASLDDVLRQWAGLGYYRRARSLHSCARRIAADFGGTFPRDEAALLDLPGFGPYTAAAVRAIAFEQRANVVDGNVERVVARLFALRTPLPKTKAELRRAAESLLPKARYGDYAQALMDLGATVCTPRNAKCDLCPWQKSCRAYALGIVEKLPRRAKAKTKPVRCAIAFILLNGRGEMLLRRRPQEGLLGGMMEVPSSAWREGPMPTLAAVRREAPAGMRWKLLPGAVRHVFSHFTLEIGVAVGRLNELEKSSSQKKNASFRRKPESRKRVRASHDSWHADARRRIPAFAGMTPVKGIWVPPEKLKDEALPSVMRKIIRHGLGR